MRNQQLDKRKKSELAEKVLEVRRVTRVVAGGKRFSFRALIVVGNKAGKVGVGIAKGLDVAAAVQKARRQAEKSAITVQLKDKRTLPYDVEAKHKAAKVRLKPCRAGHGLIAGGASRIVLELAGVKDISAKIMGRTTNKIANAMATMKALNEFIAQPSEEKKEESNAKKEEKN